MLPITALDLQMWQIVLSGVMPPKGHLNIWASDRFHALEEWKGESEELNPGPYGCPTDPGLGDPRVRKICTAKNKNPRIRAWAILRQGQKKINHILN